MEYRVTRDLAYAGLTLHVLDRENKLYLSGFPRNRPEWLPHKPGEFISPLAVLNDSQAQVLMDDLWAAGVRPTEGAGTAGSMRATEQHLSDLQNILGQVLPKALRTD